ncbi:MAG: hypothetical protein HYY20_06315 [Candidatus Tectomicrobia bacterium]|uniref:Copper resistance protein D domain-containing protein n=1 Tax=Tectimicrobiota bacterium TaxID=2528274 RepID=A0A932FWG8_UNCTE|nr:hypothetical protein [Candidatus Tectomicrobia bacterium]
MEFVSTLTHILGLILFGGGTIWLSLLIARADGAPGGYGSSFLIGLLPRASQFMVIGILLLWASGIGRLLIWGDPGLIFLPRLYGWILLVKLLLYILIVIDGMLIEHRYLPALLRNAAIGHPDSPNESFARAWVRLKLLLRLNLLWVMVAVALGESLRFCS